MHLLRIVLDNLLQNSWKYTSGKPKARIEFGSETKDGRLVYFVRDDGAGFDPRFMDRLFQPFQRLHSAKEFPGNGIGLATVQRIVRRHGGEIWAEAAVGKGATFYFTVGPDQRPG
jgi:light-regulated signal transduction histidine kinase (bacteriophytochrome)